MDTFWLEKMLFKRFFDSSNYLEIQIYSIHAKKKNIINNGKTTVSSQIDISIKTTTFSIIKVIFEVFQTMPSLSCVFIKLIYSFISLNESINWTGGKMRLVLCIRFSLGYFLFWIWKNCRLAFNFVLYKKFHFNDCEILG